ncbi:hypothetical protein [uncultured Draconibacterium sp.]|uniref:hypothetical protein n=1 Tax=uncultured Draconibacterium sp. TaxID=1573823 RepID=UPI0025CF6CA4|nr:hypothetical protein [uncultured Draconibacterium sp.]
MEIIELLRDLGIFGLFMWFIQMLLSKSASKQFETYKNELNKTLIEHQSLFDNRLELYKTELNLQNYKATKIYEQQLSIIIELHKKLLTLNQEMAIMIVVRMKNLTERTAESEDKDLTQIAKTGAFYDDFLKFFQQNILFIPQDTADKIDLIIKEYISNILSLITKKGTSDDLSFEEVNSLSIKLRTEIQEAIEVLKTDFRKLLGVEK